MSNENAVIDFGNVPSKREIDKMQEGVTDLLNELTKPSEDFKVDNAFICLLIYLQDHERILYSTISNIVYRYNDDREQQKVGILLTNLEELLQYSDYIDKEDSSKATSLQKYSRDSVIITQKAIIKLWDHINLANNQYDMLKQTDKEYDEKFDAHISKFKEELSREMNSQMITMVGIFTALAFLIFGSISSLDGVFENNAIPLFKTLSIGLVWGLCVSNMIFIFLYCIGKMTKINIKSLNKSNTTIFQEYPVVWWTNLSLIGLLLLSLWGYFIQNNSIGEKIIKYANCSPKNAFIIGTFSIIGLIFFGAAALTKLTNYREK